MAYTLISSVGTGMYNEKDGKYKNTRYQFLNGHECETRIFLHALLTERYKDFEQIMLIGSYTSSWDVFIDETDDSKLDLWMALKEECEPKEKTPAKGISEENRKQLETYLSERYHIPFTIAVHVPKIDEDTSQEIFDIYTRLVSTLKPDTRVLLDITHGFRSMPILLYQAIQFHSLARNADTIFPVELVYGEYVPDQKISYVRNLSPYWDFYEYASCLRLFEEKLNAKPLAKKLFPYWEEGAKALERLSKIIECNYSLQIAEVMKQINNALKKDLTDQFEWIQKAKGIVAGIYQRLHKDTLPEMLYAYSQLLEEKGLITQAVIALQVCAETAIVQKYASDAYIGDYDWWKDYGRDLYKKLINGNRLYDLYQLENLRNEIAHGGARDKGTKQYPSPESYPRIVKKGSAAVVTLFKILKEEV